MSSSRKVGSLSRSTDSRLRRSANSARKSSGWRGGTAAFAACALKEARLGGAAGPDSGVVTPGEIRECASCGLAAFGPPGGAGKPPTPTPPPTAGRGRGAPRSSSRTLGTNPPGTWVGETDLDEAEGGVNPRAWAAGVADALNADPRDTRALVLDEGAAALGPRPATSAASGCALTLHPFKSSFTSSTTTGGEPGATGASRTALSERDRGEDTIARSRRAACASRARTPTLDARSRDTICVDRWSVREEPCVSSTFDIFRQRIDDTADSQFEKTPPSARRFHLEPSPRDASRATTGTRHGLVIRYITQHSLVIRHDTTLAAVDSSQFEPAAFGPPPHAR